LLLVHGLLLPGGLPRREVMLLIVLFFPALSRRLEDCHAVTSEARK
jgi:hypothetical protein